MKKKALVGMISVCLLLGMTACGETGAANNAKEPVNNVEEVDNSAIDDGDAQAEPPTDVVEDNDAPEETVSEQLPEDPAEKAEHLYVLAQDAYQHSDYDNTIKYCDQAIEAGEGKAAAIAANVCAAQGKATDALNYLLTGYEMDGLTPEFIAGIGYYYLNGYGTEKNIEEAKKYYEEALLNGYTDAEAILADIENGVYND